ncbi:MAG: excinuclease ABC subunit A [Deltaproteobacteria bacterium]|nr:MAG: excinuclease ABC subunit A [Deltaproteobacteria bacterium]
MKVIAVRGARVHNLRDVDVDIPRDALVVVTGPSGSGKSSLAFDTIYAEGQRRYVESLSVHARQFLEQMAKPDVDAIEGLSPAIAIEQRTASRGPRSTVGTVTELYDYLRLLYARVGRVHCPGCGQPIAAYTVQQIVDEALALPERTRFAVIAPVVRGQRGDLADRLARLAREGFTRVAIDGEPYDLSAGIPAVDPDAPHHLDVTVDRLIVKSGVRQRLADSVELALALAGGRVDIAPVDGPRVHRSERFACIDCDVSLPPVEPRLFSFNSPHGACPECEGLGCGACDRSRLRPEARAVRLGGLAIHELARLPLADALAHVRDLDLTARERAIGERIVREVDQRLRFLVDVGLPYLSLDRPAATLSTGEAQRIRVATQLGGALSGVLYVLDEPSIGLHPRDTERLLGALRRLRDLGNTVLVVEHDEATVRAADWVVDMGPGAGVRGGEVVAAGTPAAIASDPRSITGAYLSGRRAIRPPRRRPPARAHLTVRGAREHNLRGIDVAFPVGRFVCVTGVSGSGKSSLVVDTLLPALQARLGGSPERIGAHDRIDGAHHVDRVIAVDSAPIGRSPRSNPATFTGLFQPIRDLFAQLPESRARGYKAGRYSFNVKGGRCEACEGDGVKRIEMHFLPDVYVVCDACGGRRYNRETLEVRFKGYSIADILDLTVAEALGVLAHVPALRVRLEALRDVGLDYLTLGQPAPTLSGGEAQRLKLARELARRGGDRTLYVLDEPTTGLHVSDIDRLLHVLGLLVDDGNTVIVIEHNLDVIRWADWIVDLGPEAGAGGGRVVCAGTPDDVAECAASHTGRALRDARR